MLRHTVGTLTLLHVSNTQRHQMPRGEAALNAVEMAAEARLRLAATRTTLIDDRDAILALIASALHVCRDAAGMRAPVEVSRCRDQRWRLANAMAPREIEAVA